MRRLHALTILLPLLAQAQEKPEDVTSEQIATYQTGLEVGCKRTGRARMESAEKAERYCGCVMKVLKENASQAQWQRAYFHFARQQPQEEMLTFSELSLKFQDCK
ncbi:hypothetical protein [uncultured Piscinibacter sp.]|uniref:hypothetical protein n=1 Tax=uncultured Piscinibacter sp. TaxID=1131835 RepID=UPI0026224766|nr:hypothetical protein [uncultured Piscinibacter sp.]